MLHTYEKTRHFVVSFFEQKKEAVPKDGLFWCILESLM